jgi:hypothetical protein
VRYEAGPTGYELCRELTAAAVPCEVIAPALIPRRPGVRVKTDRRDARNLGHLHRAGKLTAIRVRTLPKRPCAIVCVWTRTRLALVPKGTHGFFVTSAQMGVSKMASEIVIPQLDDLSKELLLEAAADSRGELLRLASPMQVFELQANGKQWSAHANPRYEADLEAALAALVATGLLADARQTGELFKVTQKGYQTADALKGR